MTRPQGRWIIVGINPEPWTAPEVSIGKRGGKFVAQVYKRERVGQYQAALAEVIERDYDPTPNEIPLEVQFFFWRSLDTSRSKRVDATNLQKSTEDALHELLFVNDRQVQRITSTIVEQAPDIEPTIIISWRPQQDSPAVDKMKGIRNTHLTTSRIIQLKAAANETNIEPENFF